MIKKLGIQYDNSVGRKINELVNAVNEITDMRTPNPDIFDSPNNTTTFETDEEKKQKVIRDWEKIEEKMGAEEVSYAPEGYVSSEEVAEEIINMEGHNWKDITITVLDNYTITRKKD